METESERKYGAGFNVETGAFLFALVILTAGVLLVIPLWGLLILYDYVVVHYDEFTNALQPDSGSVAEWFVNKVVVKKLMKKLFGDIKWIIAINTFLIGCVLNIWPMIKYSALGCYGIAEKKNVHIVNFRALAVILWWEGMSIVFVFAIFIVVQLACPDITIMPMAELLRISLSLAAALVVYRLGCVRMVEATSTKILKIYVDQQELISQEVTRRTQILESLQRLRFLYTRVPRQTEENA